ncbi:type II toxin-antitoxin system mRNA interferase RelE [soil metagenome]
MLTGGGRHELRVAGPAARQLDRLPEKVAAAIVEFMLGALLDDRHRVGEALRRELDRLYSARRGAYRVLREVDEAASLVVVLRVDHHSTVHRPH